VQAAGNPAARSIRARASKFAVVASAGTGAWKNQVSVASTRPKKRQYPASSGCSTR
jgi:hypothetical protein